MKINPNIAGWGKVLFFGAGAVYLWRSAFFPTKHEPPGMFDRSLRIVGAVILSAITLYFVGYGLGLYGLP